MLTLLTQGAENAQNMFFLLGGGLLVIIIAVIVKAIKIVTSIIKKTHIK